MGQTPPAPTQPLPAASAGAGRRRMLPMSVEEKAARELLDSGLDYHEALEALIKQLEGPAVFWA